MSMMKTKYHTLIVGSGCAGYHAAERLFRLGVRDIAIVTEGRTMGTSRNTGSDKQTYYKLSLCGGEADSVREMARTLFLGGGVNGDIALAEAAYSARCFFHLVELGVPFPQNEYGEFAGYKTDHDPHSRATSCGPLTSKYMTEALEREVSGLGIPLLEPYLVTRILTENGEVRGVVVLRTDTGETSVISCRNVILAVGGPAGIYRDTVYPESQHGSLGLAVEAGADLVNLEEWQYGLASTAFRWNLSGTYQQVLPRYLSVDANGTEREYLWDALGVESLSMIFLKGYQWPFDTRKMDGSSRIDLLTVAEITAGRRVYLDYTKNPRGLENGFGALSEEAHTYLAKSGALFGTPIERLAKMNPAAIDLYASHGIRLASERLEIAVCAQHCNGGVAVDANWQSTVRGLYAAGEAAGTFGVYRPGGSALNSTQVGSLRAAEHIAAQKDVPIPSCPPYVVPSIPRGESRLAAIREELCTAMTHHAAFVRRVPQMRALLARIESYIADFDGICVTDTSEYAARYRLWDMLLTQRAVLSAMIFSAEAVGTHGSACIENGRRAAEEVRTTRTVTRGTESVLEPVVPIPDAELWFETLLARQYQ